ncbi:hypothetical protein DTO166G4_6508 [Paecilomyces variotii]|nr:hypothetical protein DTO166G4_6508 [Paecilomyces variotii]KAJ9230390.1 hypothetical protein DTO166G5_7355 [Paecilomyces variotii]KAJ9298753.1 hypothetical protein DTO217A2_8384 [Paecilomyces variotii]KAJ9368458.1 hypothetical protein DTO282E5_6813 [Paecilomyces variotii]
MASQCYCAKPLRSCHRESARSALDIVLGRRCPRVHYREDGCLSSHSKDRKIRHRYYLLSFSIKLTNYCNTDEKARTSQIVKTRNRECEDSPLAP